MKRNNIIGALLLVLSLMEVAGMLLNNIRFWLFVDTLVILVCGTAGIILTRE